MSDEELVQAYVDGRISRRMFVRKLVGGGVALTAAMTYADALANATPADATIPPRVRDNLKRVKNRLHHLPRR